MELVTACYFWIFGLFKLRAINIIVLFIFFYKFIISGQKNILNIIRASNIVLCLGIFF